MVPEIIDLDDWLKNTPAGRYTLAWEQRQFDACVADLFGFHALQIATPAIATLQNNRIAHRWRTLPGVESLRHTPASQQEANATLLAAPEALPLPADQLDLVTMPHTLEVCHQPHAALREAVRVLRPEGKLALSGFNPARLLGVRPRSGKTGAEKWGKPIGYMRLRDWLHVLGFEVDAVHWGCFVPGLGNEVWMEKMRWLDCLEGSRLHFLGGVYFIIATKRVHGARILEPDWKRSQAPLQAATAAQRTATGANPDTGISAGAIDHCAAAR